MSYFRRWLIGCMTVILLAINVVAAQETIPLPEPNKAVAPKKLFDGLEETRVNFAERVAPPGVWVPEDYGQWTIPAANVPRVPPANDNFVNALELGTVGSIPLTANITAVEEATVEENELTFCYGRENSIWFKFTVPTDTMIDIDSTDATYSHYLILYRNPSGSELVFKTCTSGYPGENIAYDGLELKAGSYYLQILNSGENPLAVPADFAVEISLSSQAAPRPFSLYMPYDSTYYAKVPTFYNWGSSDNANLYDFTIERIASPVSGNPLEVVVDINGLTPTTDGDALSCEDYEYDCFYTLPASEVVKLTGEGDVYAWSVTAFNSNGNTPGYGDSTDTSTNFGLDFSQTPGGDVYFYDPEGEYIAPPTLFEWYAVFDADTYNVLIRDVPGMNEVLSKPGLTPASDSDGLECDYYYCTLTLTPAEAATIPDNGSYEWTVEPANANGSTPTYFRPFTVDSTPAPFEFYLYDPDGLVTDSTKIDYFYFRHAAYATSYDLTVSDSVPTDIIVQTGLTPDEDGDALDCITPDDSEGPLATMDEEYRYCYYYLTDPEEALFVDGDYTWTVTAHNANGDTVAYDAPEEFSVRNALAFDLLSPADNSTYGSADEITSYTWDAITDAGWTPDYYTFYLGGTFSYLYVTMSYLTAADDFDRLTCAGAVCTLDVTGVEMGNSRDTYYWSSYVYGNLDGNNYYVYPYQNSFIYTIGEVPEDYQLLLNNSFEEAVTRANFPANWDAKNLTSGAGQKCNKDKDGDGIPDKIVANEDSGECAFMIKGTGSTGKLQQTVDTTGILGGETLWFGGYYNTKNTAAEGAPQFKLTIKYTDTNVEKTKLTLEVPAGTSGEYIYMEGTTEVASSPSKMKVQLNYKGIGGKVYFDPVYLWVQLPTPRNGLLALPDSSSNSLDNRQGTDRLGARQ